MSNEADYKLIGKSALCSEITEDEAKILAEKMGVRQLKDGELLVSEGESVQSLFILASGKLAVFNTDISGKQNTIYTMTAGECAGTRAFVDQTPRKATLRAVGDATVYTLTPEDFDAVVDAHPRLAYKVMRALFRVTHSNLMRMNQETQQLSNYINKTQGRY
ncbi:Crp/Fnr family transcriptional regulator [Candidatus Nitrotoga sp. M5]|uniref:Crp/Fnr family transcriptional regulator n=1 Tax=Candidatus Nitrotoga sp. M5 TaxID=2890409 RepID=UPI001EF20492|nr:cyclic nucleotide-binding domain-containing protein [Candidatus Nitrotoga sp. M5]CAH1385423.1 Cyclic nucleotide-binding domain-containing protein [Candidatus Nitrotoga sp. M5]